MNNNQGNAQHPVTAHINVDPSQLDDMRCACGNKTFVTLHQLKYVSAFFTQTGQPSGLEIKLYTCMNPMCGLMYAGAMDKADIKKQLKNPNAMRFDWSGFFMAGLRFIKAIGDEVQKAKEKEDARNGMGGG